MAVLKAPSLALLALEPMRGLSEFWLGCLLQAPLAMLCPRGDGHPVIVLPGLGAHDFHTLPLRWHLSRLGYQALPWQQGFNVGLRKGMPELMAALTELVDGATQGEHKKVSLVGWSLGGVFARELAKQIPDKVRQVVTLGSPFSGAADATNAKWLYELLSDRRAQDDSELLARLHERPPVPVTSVFSKSDGVVAWPCSVQAASRTSESVEIPLASHLGLIANPLVHYVVANRLAQVEGCWAPFSGADSSPKKKRSSQKAGARMMKARA